MMAGIISRKDIDKTILKFINKGLLLKKEAQGMKDMIDKIVNNSDLSTYFQPDRIVMNEREILTDENQILIPDRLIFNGNLVTVIDYKTGRPEKEHEQQINNYALVLQEMNFEIHEKILVYIDKNIKVKKLD